MQERTEALRSLGVLPSTGARGEELKTTAIVEFGEALLASAREKDLGVEVERWLMRGLGDLAERESQKRKASRTELSSDNRRAELPRSTEPVAVSLRPHPLRKMGRPAAGGPGRPSAEATGARP
jgi:hypothetical protein